MAVVKLWLLRHALTEAAPGQCYGATDVAVRPERTQAVARRVAPQIAAGTVLVSSPLQRCAGLAQALVAQRPDLRVQLDPRLAEMDFGAWEGRAWADIARAELDAWSADFAHHRPGGHGESTHTFLQRVGAAYDDWRGAGRDALWVTHAGVMRAVPLLQRGVRQVERADQWPGEPLDYGALRVVELADG